MAKVGGNDTTPPDAWIFAETRQSETGEHWIGTSSAPRSDRHLLSTPRRQSDPLGPQNRVRMTYTTDQRYRAPAVTTPTGVFSNAGSAAADKQRAAPGKERPCSGGGEEIVVTFQR